MLFPSMAIRGRATIYQADRNPLMTLHADWADETKRLRW
jgi:hypothetical protein